MNIVIRFLKKKKTNISSFQYLLHLWRSSYYYCSVTTCAVSQRLISGTRSFFFFFFFPLESAFVFFRFMTFRFLNNNITIPKPVAEAFFTTRGDLRTTDIVNGSDGCDNVRI